MGRRKGGGGGGHATSCLKKTPYLGHAAFGKLPLIKKTHPNCRKKAHQKAKKLFKGDNLQMIAQQPTNKLFTKTTTPMLGQKLENTCQKNKIILTLLSSEMIICPIQYCIHYSDA